jgi:trypsin
MKVAKSARCREEGNELISGTMREGAVVCSLSADFRSDTCQGDSGGPLFTDDGTTQTVVGIVSFGIGCGETKKVNGKVLANPAIYTRAFSYRQFIVDTMSTLKRA